MMSYGMMPSVYILYIFHQNARGTGNLLIKLNLSPWSLGKWIHNSQLSSEISGLDTEET